MAKKNKQIAARKQRQVLKTLVPYFVGLVIISAAVLYVWMYYKVDSTLKEVEILQETALKLDDDINLLKDDIEYLSRVDVLTNRAKTELGMVFTAPETIEIHINGNDLRRE